jgi:beta-phosphoglucomutase
MNKIEAIIFDMEGVVVDTEPLWDEVARRILEKRDFVYDREKTKPQMMGTTIEGGAMVLKEIYGFKDDIREIAKERRELSRQIIGEAVEFIPGFLEFYETIRGKYKTAIATSSEKIPLEAINKKLRLEDFFDGHVYSIEDIGFIPKPHPDIYLFAASRLRIKPSACIGIEDSPHGVEAIKRAGMFAIAITTSTAKENLERADLIVDSFSEIDFAKM